MTDFAGIAEKIWSWMDEPAIRCRLDEYGAKELFIAHTTDIIRKHYAEQESKNADLKAAAHAVFSWYCIFGENNLQARGHLATLGNVLKKNKTAEVKGD